MAGVNPSEAQIEAAARAIHEKDVNPTDWNGASSIQQDFYRAAARAALAAALAVPEVVTEGEGFRSAGAFDHCVTYHHEGDTWWAECDDFPGFTAAADTPSELTALVDEVISTGSWYWIECHVPSPSTPPAIEGGTLDSLIEHERANGRGSSVPSDTEHWA